MTNGARRRWGPGAWTLTAGVLAALLALVAAAPGSAQEGDTATVEVRVWQNVGNELDIYISARPADGDWRTLGTIPLPLDDGTSSTGRYQYGDISLDVPLPGRALPATVEVRVWQDVEDSASIFISARPADGDWRILGTIPLPLDDGFSSSGTFRFGDISLNVPVPGEPVSTLAGTPGSLGLSDGRGSVARFGAFGSFSRHHPWALGLAAAPDGSVVVADYYNDAIRRVAPDGTVTTIARGSGYQDGQAEEARFYHPRGVAVDAQGTIYVADERNHRIRAISPEGIVTTVAGTGEWAYVDGPAEEAGIVNPRGVALGPLGDLYIIEGPRIRRLSPAGQVSTFAGGERSGYVDGPRESAKFFSLQAITIDDAGNVFVVDINDRGNDQEEYSAVRLIDTSGTVHTVLRSEGLNLGGSLGYPAGIAPAGDGGVYLSNTGLHQIVRLTRAGDLEAVAGTGEKGSLDGTRDAARFNLPGSLALSPDGVLFVADQATTVVRAVELARDGLPAGAVPLATFEGVPRAVGSTVTALVPSDTFYGSGFALAPDGNIVGPGRYFHDIRLLAPDGTVTILAGDGEAGFLDGPAEEAQFSNPSHVAVDADGNVYVLDSGNEAIRRVDPDGNVTTVLHPLGMRGHAIVGLAVDGSGNLLIAETSQGILRLEDGQLSTAARPGGSLGAIDVDASGRIHFMTGGSLANTVGRISQAGGSTVILEQGPGHYGGVLSGRVEDLAVASDGTVYIADGDYRRVVRISADGDVAIVVDGDSFPGVSGFYPAALVLTSEGDLLVGEFTRLWHVDLP